MAKLESENRLVNVVCGRLSFDADDDVTVEAGQGFTAAQVNDDAGKFTVTIDSRLIPVKYLGSFCQLEGALNTGGTDAMAVKPISYSLSNDVLSVTFQAYRVKVTEDGAPDAETAEADEAATIGTGDDVNFQIWYEYEVGGETV